jgi:hypothetical protein
MKRLLLLGIAAVLISCEKQAGLEVDALGENAGIVGSWVQEEHKGDTLLLERAVELDPDNYGFTINRDGTFIERKNNSVGNTWPVSYSNFEGTWEAVSDSLLEITVGYWGGTMNYQIRIVSLEADELAIRYLYTTDMAESR